MCTFSQSVSTRPLSSDKSTKYQVSVTNTVREATGFRSTPYCIHQYPRSISCHFPRCPKPSQHNWHQMRINELPQNTFSNNPPLGDDVCNESISVESPARNETRHCSPASHEISPVVVVSGCLAGVRVMSITIKQRTNHNLLSKTHNVAWAVSASSSGRFHRGLTHLKRCRSKTVSFSNGANGMR